MYIYITAIRVQYFLLVDKKCNYTRAENRNGRVNEPLCCIYKYFPDANLFTRLGLTGDLLELSPFVCLPDYMIT